MHLTDYSFFKIYFFYYFFSCLKIIKFFMHLSFYSSIFCKDYITGSSKFLRCYKIYRAGLKKILGLIFTFNILISVTGDRDCYLLNIFKLLSFNWEVLVVDEAHRLKNHQSMLYQELMQVIIYIRPSTSVCIWSQVSLS